MGSAPGDQQNRNFHRVQKPALVAGGNTLQTIRISHRETLPPQEHDGIQEMKNEDRWRASAFNLEKREVFIRNGVISVAWIADAIASHARCR